MTNSRDDSTLGIQQWTNDIHQGDAKETMREMPESSVHMVMTSPPYFGLRDYGEDVESTWGGDDECDHQWETRTKPPQGGENTDENPPNTGADASTQESRIRGGDGVDSDKCVKCGAWRGQLGLEPKVDQFVQNLVEVGDEVRRVLRDDGSWWLNLGDSFAGSGRGQWDDDEGRPKESYRPDSGDHPEQNTTLRRKSKMLVPHRVAIALQDAGWIVRSDAVWSKPNPMPHPVKDRLNEHKEFVFHLTPAPDYWFDLDAIREPHKESSLDRTTHAMHDSEIGMEHVPGADADHARMDADQACHPDGKNPGDIFEVSVKSFPEAHFAVYPPELVKKPLKSSCPPTVCAECGTPYEREKVVEHTQPKHLVDSERPQARRAVEIYEESDLTGQHLRALRAVGLCDAGQAQEVQDGHGNNTKAVERLAAKAKDVLGGYAREFLGEQVESTEWQQACDCDTDETDPGIVLDPFAGAGTTPLVAKEYGRRFVGIDLNPEYVAMAQKRVGVSVDEPERLLDDDETTLAAYSNSDD